MTENNKENNEELNNVNGGLTDANYNVICPKCSNNFCGPRNIVSYGSDCSERFYWKCPNCGHEWECY